MLTSNGILAAWKQSGWGEPVLKEKLDLDEVELDLPLKAVTENVTENVTDNVTEKLSELLELTKKQIIVREGNDKDCERTIVSQ